MENRMKMSSVDGEMKALIGFVTLVSRLQNLIMRQ